MRGIFKSILLGLLIGTALMIAIYGLAVIGSKPAVNLLLKMTLPPFNVVAMLMEPVAPDDLERGGRMLDVLLLGAWLQISVLAAMVVAVVPARCLCKEPLEHFDVTGTHTARTLACKGVFRPSTLMVATEAVSNQSYLDRQNDCASN